MLEPYEDVSDTAGLVLEEVDDIEGTAEIAVKHGFQVNTHAIGDRGVRAKSTSQPWRDLFNTGAIVTNGTDVPVEPIDAISSYYASVSRMMINGEKFYPEHAMTREEALQTYTLNNAIAAFEEDIKGTLTPGKFADIVVLSQDLLTVEEERIPQTTVDITIVGGEVKYRRGM